MDFKRGIGKEIKKALRELGIIGVDVALEHPREEEHGDYSTNVAMAVFTREKGKGEGRQRRTSPKVGGKMATSPLTLAEGIVEKLLSYGVVKELCERVEVAPPGFINFWLSKKVLLEELKGALEGGGEYGRSDVGKGKTMLVDHSHPNIAKRFGVGHLRSTIIGQAIIKLYRFMGWKVIADNFLGDWGTQFGALIAQIQSANIGARKLRDLSVDELERMYVEFNKKAARDPKLWEEARGWFKKLEDGDSEARGIWKQVREVSLGEFRRIWGLLDVKFDYIHGESFFEDKMGIVLTEAKEKNFAIEDQGALVVRVPGFETPLILLKSDGATTYEARDLAAIRFWMSEFEPDKIVYEVGVEQQLHFKQVFAVARMLGYAEEDRLVHVAHGLYLGPDGKKFRTRAGNTVGLEGVLEEAVERARQIQLASKSKVREVVAKVVGIGAVKYFDLLHHHGSDIVFDWEKMFVLEGNSAPYLQYTYARTRSVLAKAIADYGLRTTVGKKSTVGSKLWAVDGWNFEELAILRHFYRFPEVVEQAALNFSPNSLCNFLFELAQRYNTFYAKRRILGERILGESDRKVESFRLALTKVTGDILKAGLGLLGIGAPGRM